MAQENDNPQFIGLAHGVRGTVSKTDRLATDTANYIAKRRMCQHLLIEVRDCLKKAFEARPKEAKEVAQLRNEFIDASRGLIPKYNSAFREILLLVQEEDRLSLPGSGGRVDKVLSAVETHIKNLSTELGKVDNQTKQIEKILLEGILGNLLRAQLYLKEYYHLTGELVNARGELLKAHEKIAGTEREDFERRYHKAEYNVSGYTPKSIGEAGTEL